MLKLRLLLLLLILAYLPSCKTCCDAPPTIEETYDIPKGVKESLAFEYMIHEVEGIVFNIFYSLHERDQGVVSTHEDYNVFAGRGECASQQLDTDLNMLILNYGNGCTNDFQKFRKGQIEIEYTDPKDQIGNIIDVRLTDYYFSELGLNGQLRIENISQTNSTDAKSYSISFSNLQLFVESKASSFTGNRTIDYAKEDGNQYETTTLDYMSQNDLSFETQSGGNYTLTNSSTAHNTFGCWLNQKFLPTSGILSLRETGTDSEVTLNFNTGSCDYSLVINDGLNEEKTFDLAVIL